MEWEGSSCQRWERYTDQTTLLNSLVCNTVRERNLSNNIKANKYRMRPYATYTTLGTGAWTMFVHVSQE